MKYFQIIFIVLVLASCEKLIFLNNLYHGETPECIKEEIFAFEAEMDMYCEEGARVVQYRFQDQDVYAFQPSSCISDGATSVLDEDCTVLCTLGTIAGITECNGEEFQNAKKVKVIWKQ